MRQKIFQNTNISNPLIRTPTYGRGGGVEILVFRKTLRTYFMDDPKINFLHQPSRSMNKAWKLVLKKIDWNLNITLS